MKIRTSISNPPNKPGSTASISNPPTKSTTTYRVDIPVMLTVEVECHDHATALHVLEEAFAPAMASDPLEGIEFKLDHNLVLPNKAVIRMAVATDSAEVGPA